MQRRWMKPGRAAMLATVGIAVALVAFSRTSSSGQEPAKPSARQALRQRIADLRGEVELRDLEHEAERESLKQKLIEALDPSKQIEAVRSMILTMPLSLLPDGLDSTMKDMFSELTKGIGLDPASITKLSNSFDEALKTKDMEVVRRALLAALENGRTSYKAVIERELTPLKKAFVRHASELCLKKLEMEDLEKQYRDSR